MSRWLVTLGVAAAIAAVSWLLPGTAGPGPLPEAGSAAPVPGFVAEAAPFPLEEDGWIDLPEVSGVDAAVGFPGGWLLLDGYLSRVHRLAPDGTPLGSFGGRGGGPGELEEPRHLAVSRGSVTVFSGRGRIDLFDLDGRHRARATLRSEGCALPEVAAAVGSDDGVYALLTCRVGLAGERRLVEVSSDGAARLLDRRPVDLLREGATPVLADVGGALLHGSGDRPCLDRHPRGAASIARCVDREAPVPVPEEIRRAFERAAGARARAAGLDVVAPERYPWAVAVLDFPGGPWAVRPVAEFQVMLERMGSGAPLRALLPERVLPWPGPGGLLLVHEATGGPRVQVVRPPRDR